MNNNYRCLAIFSILFALGLGIQLTAAAQTTGCDIAAYETSKSKFDDLVQQQVDKPGTVRKLTIKRAAKRYLSHAERCYHTLQSALGSAKGSKIDEGGVWLNSPPTPNESLIIKEDFVTFGTKWGNGSPFQSGQDVKGPGTSGGTVTYSFIGNGVSHNVENAFANTPPGSNVAISSLPGFQSCFETEIVSAFNLWSAVADIDFERVTDNGFPSNASGANGDIRIGAHTFDGRFGVLAHAFFPPPNGASISGDMHFDRSEPWSCNASGIDIGIVTIHELGHAIGLRHEEGRTAIMNPIYDPQVPTILSDDINGAVAIYGRNSAGAEILPPMIMILDDE